MSIAALNWAWTQDCPNATSKLVLLALADKANDDGECWPGMDTVAAMAGVSSRQVSTHLAKLEAVGLIERRRRRTRLGRLGSYVFHLTLTTGSELPVDQEKPASGSSLQVDQRKPTSGSTPPVEADNQWKPSVAHHRKPASGQEASTKKQPSTGDGAPSRKRDEIFEVLVEACGLDPGELTSSARGAVNRAAKELREVGATPEGIRARAKVHAQRWPQAECTPSSLAKNYAQLGRSAGSSDDVATLLGDRAYS